MSGVQVGLALTDRLCGLGKSSSVDLALAQTSSVHSASSGFSAIWRAISASSSAVLRTILPVFAFISCNLPVVGFSEADYPGERVSWSPYYMVQPVVYESQRYEPRLASLFLSLVGGSGPVYLVGESKVESSLTERLSAFVFVPPVWRAGRWSHINPV